MKKSLNINFDKLYRKAKCEWPDVIDFGKIKRSETSPEVYQCENLNRMYAKIKIEDTEKLDDYLLSSTQWAFFTVLHGIAKTCLKLHAKHIRKEAVKHFFDRNLRHGFDADDGEFNASERKLIRKYLKNG